MPFACAATTTSPKDWCREPHRQEGVCSSLGVILRRILRRVDAKGSSVAAGGACRMEMPVRRYDPAITIFQYEQVRGTK